MKVGDKVRCVSPKGGLIRDSIYTVVDVTLRDGELYCVVKDSEDNWHGEGAGYYQTRFIVVPKYNRNLPNWF